MPYNLLPLDLGSTYFINSLNIDNHLKKKKKNYVL